jgi:hypothetical protein
VIHLHAPYRRILLKNFHPNETNEVIDLCLHSS